MRVGGIVLAALLMGANASAQSPQSTAYDWSGDHACIVEQSRGLLAKRPQNASDTFNWTNFDRSFFVQIRRCSHADAAGWTECERETNRFVQAMKLSAKSRGENAVRWRSRVADLPFTTPIGEVFETYADGRFLYSSTGVTASKEPAVFSASGTCSPFAR